MSEEVLRFSETEGPCQRQVTRAKPIVSQSSRANDTLLSLPFGQGKLRLPIRRKAPASACCPPEPALPPGRQTIRWQMPWTAPLTSLLLLAIPASAIALPYRRCAVSSCAAVDWARRHFLGPAQLRIPLSLDTMLRARVGIDRRRDTPAERCRVTSGKTSKSFRALRDGWHARDL